MKRLHVSTWFFLPLLLSACVGSGVRSLGHGHMNDGQKLKVYQVKTAGNSGPDVTCLHTIISDKDGKKSRLAHTYCAGAPGLTEAMLTGVVGAIAIGGGIAGAGALIRPDRTEISVTGTGTAESGAAAFSKSGASVIQKKSILIKPERHFDPRR